mmetsp:Transcript_10626/g.17323  ORF Transcript_10626/g.17323 Transcript_10626/m.17323 type:complete len:279 (-) Transcript_10626:397-1233(-)|eukprot:CAMPEP_0174990344 /NCGR_PEP_ID=MMETSP0004_2-20121128/21266_1 /TAXON_ID=420556 /ORGANISM="Ochromonas sp., Strain CCMP1393" /LENGTH=278 /DNA_ID=CAMNT_0016243935 /DNA_START=13 /DNA_END=849 /DNA_ORIENTATION=+
MADTDIPSTVSAGDQVSVASTSNNRTCNYSPVFHEEMINEIDHCSMTKLPQSDSVWSRLSEKLGKSSVILRSHWSEMLSAMRLARSSVGREAPSFVEDEKEDEETAQSNKAAFEVLANKYYSDVLEKLKENKSPNAWWDVKVVKKLCALQLKAEKKAGTHKVQNATTLDEVASTAANKHDVEAANKRKKMKEIQERDETEREANKKFKSGLLEKMDDLTKAATLLAQTPSSGITDIQPTASDERLSVVEEKVTNLQTSVTNIESGLSILLARTAPPAP